MKTLILTMLAFFSSLNGISQDLPSPASISIYHTNCLTTIDGLKSDELWTQAEEHEISYNRENHAAPVTDIYAQIQLAWNIELGIFAFVHINDDIDWFMDVNWYSFNESDIEQYLEGPWHRDNIEFFFYWGLEGEWGPEQSSTSTNDSVWSQIRFNVCHAGEEFETCLTVYTPGIDGDNYSLGKPGSISDTAIIDAVAVKTVSGWDLEVHFPFNIFARRTHIASEVNSYFGFECAVNDAEDQGFHDNHLFLLNDIGLNVTWTDKRFLNTAILVSPVTQNMECELTNITDSESVQSALFATIHNGILANQQINELKLFDLRGILLLQKQNLEPGPHLFNLNPGIYLVSVNDTFIEKMVVR